MFCQENKLATKSSLLYVILAAGERAQWLGASCTIMSPGVWIKVSRNKPGTPPPPKRQQLQLEGSQWSTRTGAYATHRCTHINTNEYLSGVVFILDLFKW